MRPVLNRISRVLVISFLVLTIVNISTFGYAMDGWKFNIMGVDPFDLKGRSIGKVALGAVASIVAHEAGHYAVGLAQGSSPSFNVHEMVVHVPGQPTQEFLGAGFASQALIGGLLTIVNKGSDFTYGFNAGTAVHAGFYGATRGLSEYSDVKQLKHGDAYAWGAAGIGAALTAVNRREGK